MNSLSSRFLFLKARKTLQNQFFSFMEKLTKNSKFSKNSKGFSKFRQIENSSGENKMAERVRLPVGDLSALESSNPQIPLSIVTELTSTEEKVKESMFSQKTLEKTVLLQLLSIVDPKIILDENIARLLGKITYNTFIFDLDSGYRFWYSIIEKCNFTSRSELPFAKKECWKLWDTFANNNPFTIKTWAVLCKKMNFTVYNTWHCTFISEYLQLATSGQHYDMAKLVYWNLFTQFSYCGEKYGWYEFTGNYWIQGERHHNPGISQFLSERIPALYSVYLTGIEKRERVLENIVNNPQENEVMEKARIELMALQKLRKGIQRLNVLLGNNSFKQAVLRECADIFYDPKLPKLQDSDLTITAYQNVVVIAREKDIFIRESYPEEYITKYVSLSIPTIPPKTNLYSLPEIGILIEWFKRVYARTKIIKINPTPDNPTTEKEVFDAEKTKEMVDYILKLWASAYEGLNHKHLVVMTGTGSNSKSAIRKLHQLVFGLFCQDLDFGSLEGSKGSGPTPGLAWLKGAKEAWISEPPEGKKLVDGMIKIITGGDNFKARFLHDQGGDITPVCLLFLVCNGIPVLASNSAMRDRGLIIPHDSVWSKECPTTVQEQLDARRFLANPDFERQLPLLAPYFVLLLLDKYREYKRDTTDPEGNKTVLKQPLCVQEATNQYWSETDTYYMFINENIVVPTIPYVIDNVVQRDKDGKEIQIYDFTYTISRREMATAYHEWFKDRFPDSFLLSTNNVLFEINNRLKYGDKDGWKGYILKPLPPKTSFR